MSPKKEQPVAWDRVSSSSGGSDRFQAGEGGKALGAQLSSEVSQPISCAALGRTDESLSSPSFISSLMVHFSLMSFLGRRLKRFGFLLEEVSSVR